MQPVRILRIGAILLLLVAVGWYVDGRLVPEFRDCDPNAPLAQFERCVDAQHAQVEASQRYVGRITFWRGALLVVVLGTAGALLVTTLVARQHD